MSVINVEALLKEISPDSPCGENLKHDIGFMELVTAAKGKPEQVMGDAVKPAEDPDWPKVKSLATKLLAKTKDLRITVYLTSALMRTNGFAGLADGLTLLSKLVDQYWDDIYPELDPDDNNDPILRMNTIEALNDAEMLLGFLRLTPLVQLQGVGQFNLRDIEVATGRVSPPNDPSYEAPNPTVIEGVFRDCDVKALQTTKELVEKSIHSLAEIKRVLTEKVGIQNAADLGALDKELKSINKIMKDQLELRGAIEADGDEDEAENGQSGASAKGNAMSGTINSRADVIRVLDKICDYYQRNEPSSPVPLLLKRAKRLVNMNFLEIMQDLVADAVKQAEKIVGVDNSK